MAATGLDSEFMDDLTKYANDAVEDVNPGMAKLGKMLKDTAQ